MILLALFRRVFVPGLLAILTGQLPCPTWASPPLQEIGLAQDDELPGLLSVPTPELEGLEPAVRAHLEEIGSRIAQLSRHTGHTAADRAEAYGRAAMVYHSYHFLDAALAAYSNAHSLAPEEFRWIYYLGLLHQQRNELGEALEYFARALELRPNDPATLLRRGLVQLAQNELEAAEQSFAAALVVDPRATAAREGLAQIALSRGDPQQAIDLLESALALDPEARSLYYPLAQAERRLDNLDRAKEHLERHIPMKVRIRDPLGARIQDLARSSRVALMDGTKLFTEERYAEAAAAFRRAVDENPFNTDALVNLATAVAELGQHEEAIEIYRRALEIDPNDLHARFNLGILLRAGAREEAVEHLHFVAEADPTDAEALNRLAETLLELGRFDEAREAYSRLAEGERDADWPYLSEATVLIAEGKHDDAQGLLEEAHRQLPDEGRIAHLLARLLAANPNQSSRNGVRAVDLASRVFDARPSPHHAATLALALAEAGDCAAAAALQIKIVEATHRAGDEGETSRERILLNTFRAGPPCRPPGTASGQTDEGEASLRGPEGESG